MFHVSMFMKCVGDPKSIFTDGLGIENKLSYKEFPVEIFHR